MFDEFSRFQQWAGRGAESLVAVFRIVVAIISRPKRLLAAVVIFALFGAVLSLHYGWLIPVSLVLLAIAFFLWRYGE
jgi:hypothetical protein